MTEPLSIQRHPICRLPLLLRPGGETTEGDGPTFDWAALVPRIVHPAQVAVVEALRWIGRPLSATELRELFDEPKRYYLALVSYHLRKLEEVGAIGESGSRQVRGAKETYYFFPPPPNGKAVPCAS